MKTSIIIYIIIVPFMKEMKSLLLKARGALKNAYAPYSDYQVGVAVLTTSGKIFCGCNIENASYGLTICAERVALFNAISQGYRKFKALAIVANGSAPYPCGACLQVMAEFAPDLTLIISDTKTKPIIIKLKVLLPKAFNLSHKNTKN
ncbi:MAG: cytidine deaminase [Planctomycetota bacterium]